MTRNILLLSAALIFAGASQSSAATTFFSNYPYNQYYGYFVCGADACAGRNYSPALQFTSAATGTTSKIRLSVSSYSSEYTSNVRVLVRADDNGLPGKILAKKGVAAPPCCSSITVKMSVDLTAGSAYWLEVAPRTGNDYALWQQSDSANSCTVAENYDGTGWATSETQTCPAAKITGNADK